MLEKSSVQTRAPGTAGSTRQPRSLLSAPRASELRAITTHQEANLPSRVSSSLTYASSFVKQNKPASWANSPNTP